jgi:tRNA-dihydrouridine synthase
MGKSFWQDLNKPIWTLAPMEGVTDTVFRQVMIQIGRPGVFYSEFTNVAGICSKGSEVVAQRLMFNKTETPVVAQLWGVQPEQFFKASELVKEMGFSGVDINLGCPVRDVVKLGACSAMIGNESQVREIVDAVKRGAKDLPVSIKTRLGRKKIVTEDWFGFLLTLDLDEITVHGRTADEMSKVPAHWDEIEKVVKLKLALNKSTIILGNGDVKSLGEAQEKVTQHGVDVGAGVGVGAV